ncbi:hypothetical protein ACFW2Y_35400 [Streptomyces sp. NPDC058877]|uniref:hypothetical protein n=1 Tax=Streptomyces sp. NPDC058877 TaxID=3346665 RepID=UPI0036954829
MWKRTALLLAAVLTTGNLVGCSGITDAFRGCEGSEGRVERLRSLDLLDSPPVGATRPRGLEDVDAGCWEDSGEAWVYAESTYTFPGTPAEVVRHYGAAADRDGWQQATSRAAVSGHPIDLCFTRAVGGDPAVLTVRSLGPDAFEEEGRGAPPELATGSGYGVSVTVDAAGGDVDCEG